MKSLLGLFILLAGFTACNNNKEEPAKEKDNRIVLRTDSVNIITLSDTMLIYESICRSCKYEGSVRFEIADSAAVVKLHAVNTHDNNHRDVEGGNVGKELVLVPVKAGSTKMKLYKFLSPETAKEDSARSQTYTIEVKN
ncbi:MAG TPA: hypothetical protein PKC54_01645 [Ferruginibacter sp.]|nr:hypothetical protein [Ferruginibacter sp.]